MQYLKTILMVAMTILMMSCKKESVTPSNTLIENLSGTWEHKNGNTLHSGIDMVVSHQGGTTYTFTELDYIIHPAIPATYDQTNNVIVIDGWDNNNHHVTGTGFIMNNDSLRLDYSISNTSFQNITHIYYKVP